MVGDWMVGDSVVVILPVSGSIIWPNAAGAASMARAVAAASLVMRALQCGGIGIFGPRGVLPPRRSMSEQQQQTSGREAVGLRIGRPSRVARDYPMTRTLQAGLAVRYCPLGQFGYRVAIGKGKSRRVVGPGPKWVRMRTTQTEQNKSALAPHCRHMSRHRFLTFSAKRRSQSVRATATDPERVARRPEPARRRSGCRRDRLRAGRLPKTTLSIKCDGQRGEGEAFRAARLALYRQPTPPNLSRDLRPFCRRSFGC